MAAWIVIVIALIVVGLLLGTTLNFVAPFLAIPIVLAVLGVWFVYSVARRRQHATSMRRERDHATTGGTEFTERDRETLTDTRR
jgi:membrane protein implicated in regulation of membrane protease activity